MIHTKKILATILLFSSYYLGNCQEVFNYQLQLAKNLEVDSIVVVINNFHNEDAMLWKTPFEYGKVKLKKNAGNLYVGKGSLEYRLASGQLLIYKDSQIAGLQLVINKGMNNVSLEDINFKISRLTRLNYTKFDGDAVEQNFVLNSLIELEGDFYDKFGVASSDDPTIRFLPSSAQNTLKIEKINLLKLHSDSEFSLLKLFEIFTFNSSDSEFVLYSDAYNSLTPKVQNTSLGKEFATRLAEKLNTFNQLRVGSRVPEIRAYTEGDSLFTNADFKKPYILAFGATWCIPCKENLPRLMRLKKELDVEVIYVNLDDDKVKWKELIQENSLDWINVTDDKKINKSKIAADFNVYYLPKYFVVDDAGKIIYSLDVLEKSDDDTQSLESSIADALENNIRW